jgi:hypothetical protein
MIFPLLCIKEAKIYEASSTNNARTLTQTVFSAVELWQGKCYDSCDRTELSVLQHMPKITERTT